MRNKIDVTAQPDALFLNPWQDRGLRLLEVPEFIWRPIPSGVIEGFAVSAHQQINRKIRAFVDTTRQDKMFSTQIEYNTVPALLEQASFRKSHVLAQGKIVLTGASATRAINTFRWENEGAAFDPLAALDAYFAACRVQNEGREIPVLNGPLGPDIPFAVECRNTFNFFHFITESLPQLTVLDDLDFQGDIYFHFPNQEEKQRDFAEAFAAALFPEFAGRIFFERTPKEYPHVLTAYEMIGGHSQAPQSKALDRIAPRSAVERFGTSGVGFQPVLAMNSASSALLSLRARALQAIEGFDFAHLPKRFFVGRGEGESRSRPLAGQDLLFEHLALFGFEYVVFETLEPLEQIALMAQAEMMVSYHGAGFTNMLFAAPETYVIELGTLQTAQFRWADFWPHAHASQCRYISFFADFNAEEPLEEPRFSTDGIVPVSVSEAATAQVMSFVVTVLGHTPQMPNADTLNQLARRLLRAGAAERAIALLEAHAEMVSDDAELCLLMADCHKALDEPKSELIALDRAYKADRSRWQTLIRIIWCANRCDRPQVIRWARSQLEQNFPERYAAFVGNHEWVRFVV